MKRSLLGPDKRQPHSLISEFIQQSFLLLQVTFPDQSPVLARGDLIRGHWEMLAVTDWGVGGWSMTIPQVNNDDYHRQPRAGLVVARLLRCPEKSSFDGQAVVGKQSLLGAALLLDAHSLC
jgi:hypothetical protein